MSLNKTNLTNAITTSVNAANSSCTTSDLVALSKSVKNIVENSCNYVALACDLPDISLGTVPEGTIFYAKDLTRPVLATATSWVGLDGRTYRKDVPDTTLYGWGYGRCGELGSGASFTCTSSPVQEITSTTEWKQLNAGGGTTHGIKAEGSLWAWGCGMCGAIGDNNNINRSSPVREASSSTNWCELSKGGSLSFMTAIKANGGLYAWGSGVCGVLANSNVVNINSPVQEISVSTWIKAANGRFHVLGIKTEGSLWAWGNGICGKLGNESVANMSSPIQEISSSTNWCDVAGAWQNSLGIKTDGTLWGWGNNFCGNNGDGTSTRRSSPVQEISSSTNWAQVSAGNYKTNVLNNLGQIFSFGYNANGELGNGIASVGTTPSPSQEFTSSTNWCGVDSGFCHVSAVKSDGTLWGWGKGDQGAIGDGTTIGRCSPVQELTSAADWYRVSAGVLYTIALKCTP